MKDKYIFTQSSVKMSYKGQKGQNTNECTLTHTKDLKVPFQAFYEETKLCLHPWCIGALCVFLSSNKT